MISPIASRRRCTHQPVRRSVYLIFDITPCTFGILDGVVDEAGVARLVHRG
jgi:hypothetical protein